MAKTAYIGVAKEYVNVAAPVAIGKTSDNYTISDKKVIINYTTTGDAYFFIKLTQPIIANKMYTLSFDCECEDDGIDVTWTVFNRPYNTFTFRNGRITVPFYTENDVPSQLLIDDTDDAEEVQQKWFGKQIVLSNFHIEDPEVPGVARKIKNVYTAIFQNLVNAEKDITVVNNGNVSLRDSHTVVLQYAAEKDTYFSIPITETLIKGTKYTVSFDCSGIEDGTALTILADNKPENAILLRNGRLSCTFTPNRDIANTLLMDDQAGSLVNVIGKEIVLSNFIIEKSSESRVARRIKKAYIGDEYGVARLWWDKEEA